MLIVCVHEVFVVVVTLIHVRTHVARANSWGTLHAARSNSGGHVNSYRIIHAVEFGEETKPRSTSARGQVRCPAVEKLASLQQAPGRLHVETWAGREGNPSLSISQAVEILPGCADMVTRLPPPLFFRVTWAGQRSAEWIRLVTDGENSQVGGLVVPGCLVGEQCIFCMCCFC